MFCWANLDENLILKKIVKFKFQNPIFGWEHTKSGRYVAGRSVWSQSLPKICFYHKRTKIHETIPKNFPPPPENDHFREGQKVKPWCYTWCLFERSVRKFLRNKINTTSYSPSKHVPPIFLMWGKNTKRPFPPLSIIFKWKKYIILTLKIVGGDMFRRADCMTFFKNSLMVKLWHFLSGLKSCLGFVNNPNKGAWKASLLKGALPDTKKDPSPPAAQIFHDLSNEHHF